jgi:hypothetical protein
VILEQVPDIDAGVEQRVALQIRALPVGVRRHTHVANQHQNMTSGVDQGKVTDHDRMRNA